MGIRLVTALEIAGNYPDNILIEGFFVEKNGLWGARMYLLKDDVIHKLILDFTEHYQTKDEAEDFLHELSKEFVEKYKNYFNE
jgi:hypothetical protein